MIISDHLSGPWWLSIPVGWFFRCAGVPISTSPYRPLPWELLRELHYVSGNEGFERVLGPAGRLVLAKVIRGGLLLWVDISYDSIFLEVSGDHDASLSRTAA